jgi:hypothetical protein
MKFGIFDHMDRGRFRSGGSTIEAYRLLPPGFRLLRPTAPVDKFICDGG